MAYRLTLENLLSIADYNAIRSQKIKELIDYKNKRRVYLGDNICLLFEDFTTIQFQIQEMLRAENIQEPELIEEEIQTYSPLIPDGTNLKATMMIQYPDVEQRRVELQKLKNVENNVWMQINHEDKVVAIPDEDLERSDDEKTSAVHFLRFEFNQSQIDEFKNPRAIYMGIDHKNLSEKHQINPEVVYTLSKDLV